MYINQVILPVNKFVSVGEGHRLLAKVFLSPSKPYCYSLEPRIRDSTWNREASFLLLLTFGRVLLQKPLFWQVWLNMNLRTEASQSLAYRCYFSLIGRVWSKRLRLSTPKGTSSSHSYSTSVATNCDQRWRNSGWAYRRRRKPLRTVSEVRVKYRKIPRIRPPFDAQKLMPKMGGGLIREDLTFGIDNQ